MWIPSVSPALTAEPDAEEHQERGVVPRPLVLGLLPVVEVPVDPLRRGEQVEHLPEGELEVHLSEVEQPPQVLVALRPGRVPGRVAGAQRPVALAAGADGGGGQHRAGAGRSGAAPALAHRGGNVRV